MTNKPIVYVDVNIVIALLVEPHKLPQEFLALVETFDHNSPFELLATSQVLRMSTQISSRLCSGPQFPDKPDPRVLDKIMTTWRIDSSPAFEYDQISEVARYIRDRYKRPDREDAARLLESWHFGCSILLTSDRRFKKARNQSNTGPRFSSPIITDPNDFTDLDFDAIADGVSLALARGEDFLAGFTEAQFGLAFSSIECPRGQPGISIDPEVNSRDCIVALNLEEDHIRVLPLKHPGYNFKPEVTQYKGKVIESLSEIAEAILRVILVTNIASKKQLMPGSSILIVVDDKLKASQLGDVLSSQSLLNFNHGAGRKTDTPMCLADYETSTILWSQFQRFLPGKSGAYSISPPQLGSPAPPIEELSDSSSPSNNPEASCRLTN